MARARPSTRELARQRRQQRFVGRQAELAVFTRNLQVPAGDPNHRSLLYVHGDAGVGKTFLLRRMADLARHEHGALTALVDETASDVPEVLSTIGSQFAEQGHPLTALDRTLATYRRHRLETGSTALVDTDGGPSAAGAALAPGAGLVSAPRSGRPRDTGDAALVVDPASALTPPLVKGLSRAAARVPWIVLFFDTYERTQPFLDPWLRELLTGGHHEPLPANLVFVLAGQRPPDPGGWAHLGAAVTQVPLGPFTDAEARDLLTARGVRDEQVVRDVLRLSHGLPVLVSTLAENPGAGDDASATAVERFLRWEQDPVRRSAALTGALPRRLDEDVFRVAVGNDAPELFAWLCSLPFVSGHPGRRQYHDVVRVPMLRLLRNTSPRRWAELHTRLADTFAQAGRAALHETGPAEAWKQEEWRELRLEELYHRLCARPSAALPGVLREGIAACGAGQPAARRWAWVLLEAGEDADAQTLREWGQRALATLVHERRRSVDLLGLLLAEAPLDAVDRARALVVRGWQHRSLNGYDAALADFRQALELDPELTRAHFGRAVVFRARGDTERALTALDRCAEREPDAPWVVRERGETYRRAGRYQEALEQLDRAVAADPDDPLALAGRGQTRALLRREHDALSDLDRALDLHPDYAWALVRRARVRSRLGDPRGALDDLERAEELEPDTPGVPGERGEVYRMLGRHGEAVAQYDRALALDPGYVWALGSRALALEALGRREEALADLTRAVGADPSYGWAVAQRRRLLGEEGSAPDGR
ncbi:hypothetical protein AQ490_19260 [Wenjunlia vitaminophila]|uniref:Orc1-like AAA ATPase domain-containing protein n=1 Tax=Wenjunlia vitaminophila TaxID=76728 RepID=A0A0T6LVG1_WENVI|nr:tetratricopeptide repeat protein [Wenjunlia vitaminophila]KRV49826.1 hypothetical protein AQ490_19260 [Wenjunlia vitaminophila]